MNIFDESFRYVFNELATVNDTLQTVEPHSEQDNLAILLFSIDHYNKTHRLRFMNYLNKFKSLH